MIRQPPRSKTTATPFPSTTLFRSVSAKQGDMPEARMADRISAQGRSDVMRRIRKTDTRPELAVRRLVHALGYRYRLYRRNLPGTPDLVFSRRRKVIFEIGRAHV